MMRSKPDVLTLYAVSVKSHPKQSQFLEIYRNGAAYPASNCRERIKWDHDCGGRELQQKETTTPQPSLSTGQALSRNWPTFKCAHECMAWSFPG